MRNYKVSYKDKMFNNFDFTVEAETAEAAKSRVNLHNKRTCPGAFHFPHKAMLINPLDISDEDIHLIALMMVFEMEADNGWNYGEVEKHVIEDRIYAYDYKIFLECHLTYNGRGQEADEYETSIERIDINFNDQEGSPITAHFNEGVLQDTIYDELNR